MTALASSINAAVQSNRVANPRSTLSELIAAMPIVILLKAMRSASR